MYRFGAYCGSVQYTVLGDCLKHLSSEDLFADLDVQRVKKMSEAVVELG